MDMIEIPFGAKDSELKGWEYTIPEGMEAVIEDGKVIVRVKESEDERIRKEIIAFLKHYHTGQGESVRYDDDWIVYLEKQKEQKPAEWSEEDEKAAYFINQFLEYHEASDPTAKSCKEWFNNRLKSLHPDSYKNCNSRWKPSEEQMRFLLAVINEPNNAGSESCHIILKSLYHDLKNLK